MADKNLIPHPDKSLTPIKQGVISNIISAPLVYYGGSTVTFVITTLVTYLKGLSLPLAIILGVGVALILAITANIVSLIIIRHQKDAPSLSPIKPQCPDNWLHNIADDQARTLYRWVHITNCEYRNDYDLLREDPYVDFVCYVDNRSVHNVRFEDLGGCISFGRRRLTQKATWDEKPDILTHGNIDALVIHQPLTKEDVIYILNASGDMGAFGFGKLEISISGYGDGRNVLALQRLHTHHLELSSKALFIKYPKLHIEVKQVVLIGQWTETQNAFDSELIGSVINVQVYFKNRRSSVVDIESFKLDTSPNVARVTNAESGEIYDLPHLKFSASRLDNLTHCPIRAEQGHPYEGWLQFILLGVKPESLEGSTPTLIIADSSGEKHPHATLVLKRG